MDVLFDLLIKLHFQLLAARGPWGDHNQNARHIVRDRPPPLYKISATCVEQFWRRCVANRETDRHSSVGRISEWGRGVKIEALKAPVGGVLLFLHQNHTFLMHSDTLLK